jgi:hypothetical protein
VLDGDDALRRPVHDGGGSTELSIGGRHNAAAEAATPHQRRGGYTPFLARCKNRHMER